MTELERYKQIGTVDECKKAMNYYNDHHRPRHPANENCNTGQSHGNCNTEYCASWCIWYKHKT